MARISDKVRKELWGSSGNRCSICKNELVYKSEPYKKGIILGEECHIIAYRKGARYDPSYPKEKLNSYENLLLLCPSDHKIIDDNEAEFTVEKLRQIKKKHVEWVSIMLSQKSDVMPKMKLIRSSEQLLLRRISFGSELVGMGDGCHRYGLDFGDPQNDEEREAIKTLGSLMEDMDVIPDIGFAGRIDFAKYFDDSLIELAKLGFVVYAGVEKGKMLIGENEDIWLTLIVVVKRASEVLVKTKEAENS